MNLLLLVCVYVRWEVSVIVRRTLLELPPSAAANTTSQTHSRIQWVGADMGQACVRSTAGSMRAHDMQQLGPCVGRACHWP